MQNGCFKQLTDINFLGKFREHTVALWKICLVRFYAKRNCQENQDVK